jgi:hypothetical protein
MSKQQPQKTVLEVFPDTHRKVRRLARGAKESTKRFASLLLNYAAGKYEAGDLVITDPTIAEKDAEAEPQPATR